MEDTAVAKTWAVNITSLFFIVLQSGCTAVMAIGGIRFLIGLSSFTAAFGSIYGPARGFHSDAIRIPMMVIAVAGSLINLYVIWRIRSLRSRPASQWRVKPATPKQVRSERIQLALAYLTLLLVVAEAVTHHIIHRG